MPQNQRYSAYVFDLDNTLYACASKLFQQIDSNMTKYVEQAFNLPFSQAQVLQKKYFEDHGTTLYGLMKEHNVDPFGFLEYVHGNVDYSWLNPNPVLANYLKSLDGKKIVFTNASVHHADRVLARLGIDDCFDGCFDIIQADFFPKPHFDTYQKLLQIFDINPKNAIMFDDIPKNLVTASKIGMQTVLILHDDEGKPYQYNEWEHGNFVNDKTDDLNDWLKKHINYLQAD